jgi:hypothetical protein
MSTADIEDAIKNKILPQYAQQQPPEEMGLLDMTGRALARGTKQLGVTFGDIIPAMAAKAVGADEYAQRQMEEAAASQKEIQEKYAPRYESYRNVQGLGDVLPYLLEAGVEQIPNVATVLIPGGAAGMAGRAVAGRMAAEKGAEVLAKQALGQKAGQAAGVYLGSYALNSPEIFQNVFQETGQMEPGVAMLYGSVSAALDSAFPAYVLNKLTGPVKQKVVEKVLEKSGAEPSIIKSALRNIGIGVATEGLTEGAQEAISIAAERFVAENSDVWGSKEFQRVVDAGIAGAAGSVLFGGVAGAAQGAREKAAFREEKKAREGVPAGKNAFDELDEDERAAIQAEAAGATTPTTPSVSAEEQAAIDAAAEAAFPSAQTLQQQYDQLETERRSLLEAEQTPETQSRLQEIDTAQMDLAEQIDQMPADAFPSTPRAAMGEQQGFDLGEPVSQEQRTAPVTTTAPTPQQGLDLGAPVEQEERGAPKIETVTPSDALVTDVSAAPLERFIASIQPSSPSEIEGNKQRSAISEDKGLIRDIRDMYEDLGVDDKELPYYTGLVKEFFGKYFKPVSPEVAREFENIGAMSPEQQKDFLQRHTKLPDLTTYDGVNKLRTAFNDFVSEQQLKGFGVTPGTNAYAQAKQSLARLRQKAQDPSKLDKAERAAHDYFRRFDFDTALRAAAFDMAYGTPRNELFSGQGATTAPFFQEWLLLNSTPEVNRKFENYRKAYENRARRDAEIDRQRAERSEYLEEEAATVREYEEAERETRREFFPTSEKVTGPLNRTMHPAVQSAIKNNDLNGALRAMMAVGNLTPYQRQLVTRLLSLKLKSSVGFDNLEQNLASYFTPDSRMVRDFDYIRRSLDILGYKEAAKNMEDITSPNINNRERLYVMNDTLTMALDLVKGKEGSENLYEVIQELQKYVAGMYSDTTKGAGLYFPDTDSISLLPENDSMAETNYVFLHEVMHAATTRIIENPEAFGDKQVRAVKELKKLYEYAKTTSGVKKYGFVNLDEFVAEAFTNHEFQKLLQSIPYKNTSKDLWSKFMQYVMRLFGMENVLSQTMRNVEMLFDAPKRPNTFSTITPRAAKRGYYENNSNEEPSAIRFIGDQIRNSKSFDDIKFVLSNSWATMKDQTRKYWLGAFTLRQIEEMMGVEFGKAGFEAKIPQVSQLIRSIEGMQDSRNKTIQKGKPILDKLMKLYSSNEATSQLLTTIIQTATSNQVDPSSPNEPSDKTKKKLYTLLRADWERLGKMKDGAIAQELYGEMRQFYKDTLNNYKRISIEREFRRILGSKEAAERAAQEYIQRNLPVYKKTYATKTEEEIRQMLEDEVAQQAQKLIASGKETADTALAKVLADAKIEDQFKDTIDPYFPLKRFGNFWYKEGSGVNMKFYMFESAFARDKALADARKKNPSEAFASGNDVRSMTATALQNARLFEELKSKIGTTPGESAEQLRERILDELGELFITTLPSQSIRNMFLHRKNVPGASADMVRSFAHSMFHMAYQQARYEYSPKILDNLSAAESYLKPAPGEVISEQQDVQNRVLNDYLNEIRKRVETALSPAEQSWITTLLSNLSFLTYLTAPASAIVNMLAVPTIGYPVLAGPYGWGPARQSLTKYMKALSGAGWKDEAGKFDTPSVGRSPALSEVEKKAYQAFVDAGVIDISMTHDIAGLAEQPSNDYTGRWHKIMTFASFPFHKAERFNREVTVMAAFDLAYKKNGGNFKDAVEQAKKLTYKSMFDYSTVNKPRYFQGDLPKILLQFKQYAQHMTYLLFRTAYESTSLIGQEEYKALMAAGKTEEAQQLMEESIRMRQDARRAFTGMMGMSFLFAGTMGMPVWFIFSGIANAFAAVFGDDEEEYDVENWYKNWLHSVFGGVVGDSIARGVVPQLTGASLSDRMSTNLTDMWFRDIKRNQDEVSYVQNVMINLLGPVAGMGINAAEAVKRYNDGNTYRAFEAVSPAVLKNLLAGSRIASEGALTMKGDTLLDDISGKEAFIQMLGFTPERLAQRQAANIEAKAMEVSIDNRRQDLLNFLAMAYEAGDGDAVAEVLEKIGDFNMANPEKVIKPSTIINSLKKRAKVRAMAEGAGGLRVNKAFLGRAAEMTEYAEDED